MSLRLLVAVQSIALAITPVFAKQTCSTPPGGTVSGSITRYVDGDTFDSGRDRIRPWGINAPERGEFGFDQATQTLRSLTSGRALSCTVKYLDNTQSHRCVAVCSIAGVGDLGEAMLRSGWVKVHRRYVDEDPSLRVKYEAAEKESRDARRGLWQ